MRIVVIPEQLIQAAQHLRRAQAEWQAQAAQLQAHFNSLDWETRQKSNAQAQVEQARSLAEALGQRAGELAAFLEGAAARFRSADEQGAGVLAASISPLGSALGTGWGAWSTLGNSALNAWRGLSSALGALLPGELPLPVSAGMVSGIGLLASLPWLMQFPQTFFESLWNWLHGFGWRSGQVIISPLPEEPRKAEADRGIQDLAKQGRVQDSSPKPEPPRSVQTLKIEEPQPSSSAQTQPKYEVWHEVPIQSQGKLYGNAACLPTSASMVLSYYHNQDPHRKTASAQDLINMLDPGDGTFGKGIVLDRLNDDLAELGYQASTSAGTMDTLKSELKNGPVVTNVQVDLVSVPARDIRPGSTYQHSIVVKGMGEDTVVVNDPWSGQEKSFSRADFEKMWTNGGNWMVLIRPK